MSAFFVGHPKETDLALFAGGELGPLSRWRIERHIEGCTDCKELVTEYFHLTEELQPLAELPDLNWDAMARGIERRLASEQDEPVRPRIPAMAWAASLAAVAVISGIVVVRQQPASAPSEQVAAMESATMESAGEVADLDQQPLVRQAAPAAPPQTAVAEMKAKVAEEAPAAEPEQPALLEKREVMESDRADLALADEMAPPPPPMPSGLQSARSAAAPAANFAGGFGGDRRALRAPAPIASAVGESRTALDIQPLFDPSSEVRVAADGWISVRSISAEGRVTITDVYAP